MEEHPDIPADVKALLARHIDSVVQLELLLLLQRDANAVWTAQDAARELRVEPAWTREQLDRLATRGLIGAVDAGRDAYRFAPDHAAVVGQLARLYADRRVSVIALIYSKPTDTLRTFADAFRLRKDGGKEGRDG